MTIDRFNDEFDDELLSAYVDGELTADDRALVEDRLRTDPQAALLVEELRSLSSAVKSLPRETLGRDLRASIFEEIDHAHHDHDEARRVIPLSEPLDPPRGFRRGFFWSTIAIAAALMIMFLQDQEQNGDRDVAAVAKKDAQQTAADRDNGRLALEDGELPNLGEMRSFKAPQDEALPAAPAPAEPAAAEPAAMAEIAPADGAELERFGNEPATEQQVTQFGAQPTQTEALAELEAGQSDALDAAAASAPAAVPIDQPTPLATVELAVKAEDGLTRFKRHLVENNFATPTPPEEAAAGLGGGLGGESESISAGREVNRHYARGGGQKSEVELAPVEVLVEGSPQQIENLVAACQTDRAYFAEVNAPDYLTHNGLFSFEAAPTGGAVAGSATSTLDAAGEIQTRQRDLAARPQSRAVGPQEEAEQRREVRGRAWILSHGLFAGGGGRQEANKAKEEFSESAVELGTPLEDKADLARRSTSLGFRQQTDSLAKQLSQPPEEGRVRVRFVLRDAEPQATAAPAAAKP